MPKYAETNHSPQIVTTNRFPAPVRTHPRFVALLGTAAMGTYLLIIVGATTAVTDASSACSTWPACGGQWLVPLKPSELFIAWGHRVVALIVGLLLLATGFVAWRGGTSQRVLNAIVVPITLFPVQVGIGAIAATAGVGPYISGAHLAIGIAIFGSTVFALAWTLEQETGTDEDDDSADGGPHLDPDPLPDANAPTAPEIPDEPTPKLRLKASAYLELMKPRLMWLLSLVAAASMALAAGPDLAPGVILKTLGGGVLAIGASGTFNHVLERDVDRKMARTADRALAVDLVSVRNAVAFGVILSVASLALFASINLLAAGLGLTAIVFYSVIYTLVLKPNTVQNTVIGGAAGALPALIGWAAVEGSLGVPGLALGGLIFLWTPAHFYNLALAYKEDYARGGFPMMPVVRGDAITRKHITLYFAATLSAATVLTAVGGLGPLYALASVGLGSVFLWAIVRLHWERTESAALRAFHASNAYLGIVLVTIVVDAIAV
ncbi:MAG: protoheme IX farnesyltransferase [Natrialbaceae archaeon]|jgi:protoheme IX farnesyltransferase